MLSIKTPSEKRALIQVLERDNPELLDFIKLAAVSFGKFVEIQIDGQEENKIREAISSRKIGT
jgi:hypothetical protein